MELLIEMTAITAFNEETDELLSCFPILCEFVKQEFNQNQSMLQRLLSTLPKTDKLCSICTANST